jgi:hypothetical protein
MIAMQSSQFPEAWFVEGENRINDMAQFIWAILFSKFQRMASSAETQYRDQD